MNLSTLSTGQLYLYLHELEEIFSILREIVPTYLAGEEKVQYEIIQEQAYTLEDRITFEIARRQLVDLQAKLTSEHNGAENQNHDDFTHELMTLQGMVDNTIEKVDVRQNTNEEEEQK